MKTWYVQTGDVLNTGMSGHAIHPDEARIVTLHKVRVFWADDIPYLSTYVKAETLRDATRKGIDVIARHVAGIDEAQP